MKRDYSDYIKDIITSIEEIEKFTSGMKFKDFENDKKTINAVIRSLEVMGEAVKKIPESMRKKFPNIPWKRIAGMRDKLIHEYHGVDIGIVWVVIKDEIPPLNPHIKKVYDEISHDNEI